MGKSHVIFSQLNFVNNKQRTIANYLDLIMENATEVKNVIILSYKTTVAGYLFNLEDSLKTLDEPKRVYFNVTSNIFSFEQNIFSCTKTYANGPYQFINDIESLINSFFVFFEKKVQPIERILVPLFLSINSNVDIAVDHSNKNIYIINLNLSLCDYGTFENFSFKKIKENKKNILLNLDGNIFKVEDTTDLESLLILYFFSRASYCFNETSSQNPEKTEINMTLNYVDNTKHTRDVRVRKVYSDIFNFLDKINVEIDAITKFVTETEENKFISIGLLTAFAKKETKEEYMMTINGRIEVNTKI